MAVVLREFIDAIEVTGGVIQQENGICYPVADPEWSDLANIYLRACEVAGTQPMVTKKVDNDQLDSTFI